MNNEVTLQASVITLTCNRVSALQRCLESLTKQNIVGGSFELILVDVSDQLAMNVVEAFADRLNIRHLFTENKGVAANRNYGAHHAESKLLIFLDDDCVAEPLWLENFLKCAEANPGFLIGGSVRNMNPDNAVSCAGQVITEAVDACFNPEQGPATFFPGLNMAVPRNAYLSIGGCDESFEHLAAEDRDLNDRWLHAGGQLVKAPDTIVKHEHRLDFRGFVRQYFNYGRGAWKYHGLRESRGGNLLDQTAKLHLNLRRYTRQPLSDLPTMLRLKVILLLVVWELVNAAGFAWQAIVEWTDRICNGSGKSPFHTLRKGGRTSCSSGRQRLERPHYSRHCQSILRFLLARKKSHDFLLSRVQSPLFKARGGRCFPIALSTGRRTTLICSKAALQD